MMPDTATMHRTAAAVCYAWAQWWRSWGMTAQARDCALMGDMHTARAERAERMIEGAAGTAEATDGVRDGD